MFGKVVRAYMTDGGVTVEYDDGYTFEIDTIGSGSWDKALYVAAPWRSGYMDFVRIDNTVWDYPARYDRSAYSIRSNYSDCYKFTRLYENRRLLAEVLEVEQD